jgi:4-hydroxyphenylacetate 3-monooxygenase
MRDGAAYLSGLHDERHVQVDGDVVADVTEHPGFAGIARTIAGLYDHAADPANGMCAYSDEAGGSVNVALAIPRSRDALCVRRAAITQWANLTGGFVGRSPDHVGGFLAGFASAPEVFNRGDRSFGENVTQFYRRVVSDDLFVSYVIIPPQGAGVVSGVDQVRVVGESSEGMVVSGAQILGTSSAVSDFLFVSCIRPLRPDQETEAVSFVVPLAAPGLRLHCRRPYGQGQPSVFDYPLSTRFDETDAVAVFDEVVVPWENVFVCRDVALTRDQFFATAAHVLGNSQAQIRFVVKLKLILAVAHRMAEVNGIDSIPSGHRRRSIRGDRRPRRRRTEPAFRVRPHGASIRALPPGLADAP